VGGGNGIWSVKSPAQQFPGKISQIKETSKAAAAAAVASVLAASCERSVQRKKNRRLLEYCSIFTCRMPER